MITTSANPKWLRCAERLIAFLAAGYRTIVMAVDSSREE